MYAKIFSSMWDGTLYGQWEAWSLLVFLLAKCDSEGFVDIHPTAISGMTGMPIEAVRKGIEILESPDAQSKSSELEGARIERIDEHRDWGWRIVNYLHYRRLVDPDVVKLQNRDRQKKRRHALSRSVTPGHAPSRQAEAEAEAEVKEREKKNAPKKPARPSSPSQEPERQSGKARPVFSGQSLSVWQWQIDKLLRALGPHRDSFGDLFDWFVELDSSATKDGLVIPSRDGGAWLISQIMSEAGRRGIAIKQEPSQPLTAEQLRRRDTFGRTDEENAKNLADLEQYFARERQAKPPPT